MEELKHECGVALVRLLKPRDYYEQKCGTASYALNKLYLMMEKEHNRGQEGAGIACVNMDAPVGTEYMFRGQESLSLRQLQYDEHRRDLQKDDAKRTVASHL